MFVARPYLTVNVVFFVLLLFFFLYILWFQPGSHPIPCIHKTITGSLCPGCGTTRAFSYFLKGQLEEGRLLNIQAFRVFVFFVLQFFFRGAILSGFVASPHFNTSILIKLDVVISISLFLLAFLPFILKL